MKELENKQAGTFAFAAAIDAQRRNNNNKSLYSAAQIRKAITVSDLLDTGFSYTSLYINYRKNFIAVKAEFAKRRGAISTDIIKCFEQLGYNVAITPQGLIVRLDKAAI